MEEAPPKKEPIKIVQSAVEEQILQAGLEAVEKGVVAVFLERFANSELVAINPTLGGKLPKGRDIPIVIANVEVVNDKIVLSFGVKDPATATENLTKFFTDLGFSRMSSMSTIGDGHKMTRGTFALYRAPVTDMSPTTIESWVRQFRCCSIAVGKDELLDKLQIRLRVELERLDARQREATRLGVRSPD